MRMVTSVGRPGSRRATVAHCFRSGSEGIWSLLEATCRSRVNMSVLVLLFVLVVGFHDALHQGVADHILAGELAEANAFDAFEHLNGLDQAGLGATRSEEHTSELQSRPHLVCRLL